MLAGLRDDDDDDGDGEDAVGGGEGRGGGRRRRRPWSWEMRGLEVRRFAIAAFGFVEGEHACKGVRCCCICGVSCCKHLICLFVSFLSIKTSCKHFFKVELQTVEHNRALRSHLSELQKLLMILYFQVFLHPDPA